MSKNKPPKSPASQKSSSVIVTTAVANEFVDAITDEAVLAVGEEIGVISNDLTELGHIGVIHMNNAMSEVARAGFAFCRAHSLLGVKRGGDRKSETARAVSDSSNEFTAWIDSQGVQRQRVYDAMRVARFAARFPADERERVLGIGIKKTLLLASLSDEQIYADSERDLIEDADKMTVTQLRDEVRSMQGRTARLEKEIERRDTELMRMRTVSNRIEGGHHLSRWSEDVRAEALSCGTEIELAVGKLRKTFDAVVNETSDAQADPEWKMRIAALYREARTGYLLASQLVADMAERAGADLPEQISGTDFLLDSEAQNFLRMREELQRRDDARRLLKAGDAEAIKAAKGAKRAELKEIKAKAAKADQASV